MRRVLLGVVAVLVAAGFVPAQARAGHECSLPHTKTLWIDFAEGSTDFWPLFAKPGQIIAASNFIYPAQIRARGARTVYMDINFRRRVGTPTAPVDPAMVVDRANRLYDYAAASLRCSRPPIALNELFGARTATPWSPGNAQYRANVLLYMRTLAARGARPFLLISQSPYTGGEAADWWREAASIGDLVREVYFPAPNVFRQGALRGNRYLRAYFRRAAAELIAIGIPPSKIGLMLGFQTTKGKGGRDGLQPARAWFTVVKWQALSARHIARELGLSTVWSWGWEAYSDAERDPDKAGAACVWLWVRNPRLCNGPKAAGPGFNASLTDGQIDFPQGVQCKLDGRVMSAKQLQRLTRVTGDRELTYSALYQRLVEGGAVTVTKKEILEAERAIITSRFGSRAGYRSAIARAGATLEVARGIIGDELRRVRIKAGFRGGIPSGEDVTDYFESYGETLARPVQTKPAAWWLNGRSRGLALDSSAPAQVFRLGAGKWTKVWTVGGTIRVRALGAARPLSTFGISAARPSIVAALRDFARSTTLEKWTLDRQRKAQERTLCVRDNLPQTDAVDLTDYLPFLELR
jgi:hypothetical protein